MKHRLHQPRDHRRLALGALAAALTILLVVVAVASDRKDNPPASRTVPSTVTTLGVQP